MNKNRIITGLIVGVMILSLQGCSLWKRDQIFSFWQKEEIVLSAKNFTYSYQEPDRKNLSSERVKSLRLKSPHLLRSSRKRSSGFLSREYYSANGNVCRFIDISDSEVVCAVSGKWKSSPPILANSVGQ